MIIDSHAHIFEHFSGIGARGEVRAIGDGCVRFLDGTQQRIIPQGLGDTGFCVETLLEQMDRGHIDKAILLHGLLYGLQNEYVYECVKKYPDRLKGSGSLDPCIAEADKIIDRLLHHFGFDILKFELSSGAGMTGLHPDLKINGKEFERIYEQVEKSNVTIVFDIGSRGMQSFQVEELLEAAAHHPEIKFVVCHLLAEDGKNRKLWENDMHRLAKRENIWYDITAVPWNMKESYPYPKSYECIKAAKNIVGSGRLIWGSDVPQLLVVGSYEELYDFLLKGDGFLPSELDDLFYRTSQTVYGVF